jgi:hypothetical protein
MSALEADEQQELRNTSRRMAAMAELQWQALMDTELPERIVDQAFLAWWNSMIGPKLEMPDFSSLFNTDNS